MKGGALPPPCGHPEKAGEPLKSAPTLSSPLSSLLAGLTMHLGAKELAFTYLSVPDLSILTSHRPLCGWQGVLRDANFGQT